MHLDSEKLPRGFADKAYHEDGTAISQTQIVGYIYKIVE